MRQLHKLFLIRNKKEGIISIIILTLLLLFFATAFYRFLTPSNYYGSTDATVYRTDSYDVLVKSPMGNVSQQTRYREVYSYAVGDRKYEGYIGISHYNKARIGQTIKIFYQLEKPFLSEENSYIRKFSWIFIAFISLIICIGSLISIYYFIIGLYRIW